jgi:magnesium and cobalt transporter
MCDDGFANGGSAEGWKGQMGSSSDGADPVEHTSDPEENAQRGLFGRLFKPRSPSSDASDRPEVAAPGAPVYAPQTLGLSNLRRLRVDDVAIPKAEIEAVPVDIGKDDLVAAFRKHGYSRLPVYKETLDKPLGQVLLKDLALGFGFGQGNGRFNLRKLLRPVLYAPPSMPVGVLLQKMQRERVHMALVIDEYGGVDGLVTIEDLIETIIGEIEDEHDKDEAGLWAEEKPGVYLAQARAPLDEFEAMIGLRLRADETEEEVDTLGGLVFLLCGRVPARGEVITNPNGVVFEVVDADPRRIKRLRVRLPVFARTGEENDG